ncbi:hypothetical protein [Actinomadura montaniterrae]|uniref:Uncharacterized protein n=1 Tax=Actinomadura montaniterrae TaxID=1803903 RepID=A0A6L3W750_9ACTN|nr:hypothetical protein [Actinomadura montaniterrae]KAB2388818.1 hypothetical protein F9B16_02555 [Actinomadura montaniterrae]
MKQVKLIRGLAATGVAAAAMATFVIAPSAEASTIRAHLQCSTPKSNRVNYSWGSGYHDSVTVYFNNHCSGKVAGAIWIKSKNSQIVVKCMVTNGGTKGKHRFWLSDQKGAAYKVTRGC